MKRTTDPGRRIISYKNQRKMFYSLIALIFGLAGTFFATYVNPVLWPVLVFGFYAAIVLLQYPNITIYYTSRKYRLWWGPFLPIFRKTGSFEELYEIQIESKISQSPYLGLIQRQWHVTMIYKTGKTAFFNSLSRKEDAESLGQSLASDLILKVRVIEHKENDLAGKLKEKLTRKR